MFHLCSLTLDYTSYIIQRRGQFGNPSTYFRKTWTEYKTGFNSNGELWLGLDQISALTSTGTWRLDVVLGDWDGQTYNARYNHFSVGLEATDYTLTIASFDSGASTLGDDMIASHSLNGMKFSTMDVDNDNYSGVSCSSFRGYGGWWFSACGYTNLNGQNDQNAGQSGIRWYHGGNRGRSGNSWKSSQLTITQIG